ncbi:hypothetical protein LBMAG48_16620 [Phycisphaerae bacterium]|jgi:hypothetical protein|nr:hypothetical protein LBMAG48_16620 [Phycisphaerae bacterium]
MAEKYENFQQIRSWLRMSPFRPFEVILVDGRRYEVQHPENMLLPANPRESLIAILNKSGSIEMFNSLVISVVRPIAPRTKRRKAS